MKSVFLRQGLASTHAPPAHRRLAAGHDEALPRCRCSGPVHRRPDGRDRADRCPGTRTGLRVRAGVRDVFESNALPHRVVARALEAMKEAGVPFYLLPGNHDPLDAASLYDSEEFTRSCPANVHVLRSAEPVPAGGNVQIVAAPWRSKHPAGDPLKEAREQIEDPHHEQTRERVPDQALDPTQEQPQEHQEQPQEQPDQPQHASGAAPQRIIAGHGAVDVLSPDAQDPALIRTRAWQRLFSEGEVAYVALGDRHSTTEVQQGIAYSGAPEVTDFVETDPGHVLVVELAGGH